MPVIGIGNNTTFQNNPFGTPDNTYTGIESVYLGEGAPDFPYTGNTEIAVGLADGDRSHSLIRASSLSNIPSSATITQATLYISGGGGFGTMDIEAHGMLRPWVNAEATWNSYSTGNAWTTPGALGDGTDRQAAIDDSISNGSGYLAIDVTQITQDIVDGTNTEPSAALYAIGAPDSGFRFFADALLGTDGQRVEWVVNYTVPSGITGSSSSALGNVTSTATGNVSTPTVSGSISELLEDTTSSITGNIVVVGTSSTTLANFTSSADGSVTSPGVSGSLSETLEDNTSTASGLVWARAVFGGAPPDLENTESFYELGINDLGFTAEINDILHYTQSTGLSVDTQFIPVVDPAAAVSGTYYFVDVSTGNPTAKSAYTIDQRTSGEIVQTMDAVTSAASGTVSGASISGTLGVSTDDVTSSISATLTVLGSISLSTEDTSMTASGSSTLNVSGSLSESLEDVLSAGSGDISISGSVGYSLIDVTSAATGELLVTGTASSTLGDTTSAALGAQGIAGSLSESLDNVTSFGDGGFGATFGILEEVVSTVTMSSSGELIINASLSEVTADATSSASGNVVNTAILNENLDSVSSSISGTLLYVGEVVVTYGDVSSSSTGEIVLNITGTLSGVGSLVTSSGSAQVVGNGDLISTLGNVVSSATGVLTHAGNLSEVVDNTTVVSTGTIANVGTLTEVTEDFSGALAGLIIQDISGTLSETLSATTSDVYGSLGVGSLIQLTVEDMLDWLPDNNVLTEAQLEKIVIPLFDELGAGKRPEILCKALERAALRNKAKAITFYGLSKEKVYGAEYYFNSGGASPSDLWDDYIRSLAEICPIFGYNKPSSLGIKVNSGDTINPLKNCDPPDYQF